MQIDFKKISIRKANIKDSKLIFDWANEPSVRENSINSYLIDWDSHQIWFKNKLNSDSSFIFILEEKIPLGQIRFDRVEESDGYFIDLSIDKLFRGSSLGSLIIKNGIIELTKLMLKKISIFASVKKENVASIKSFLNNNFEIVDQDSLLIHLKLKA